MGFGLAYLIAKALHKDIYTKAEIENLKSAVPMGFVNIVEGVIPIVMNDLGRGIIAAAAGGMTEGAVLMTLTNGAGATVPFGGVLMLPTMGEFWYAGVLAILANVAVTGLVYALIKPAAQEDAAAKEETEEEDLDLDSLEIL